MPTTESVDDPQWHRQQGVAANNATWTLFDEPSSPERDEALLRGAYAAAYHWERAAGAGPANEARAAYLVAKALLATGQADRALVSAEHSLAVCRDNGLEDFDLAYGHEVVARALHAVGHLEQAQEHWAQALAVPVADPEDREIVEADLSDGLP